MVNQNSRDVLAAKGGIVLQDARRFQPFGPARESKAGSGIALGEAQAEQHDHENDHGGCQHVLEESQLFDVESEQLERQAEHEGENEKTAEIQRLPDRARTVRAYLCLPPAVHGFREKRNIPCAMRTIDTH